MVWGSNVGVSRRFQLLAISNWVVRSRHQRAVSADPPSLFLAQLEEPGGRSHVQIQIQIQIQMLTAGGTGCKMLKSVRGASKSWGSS